jgi:hypothetical protein
VRPRANAGVRERVRLWIGRGNIRVMVRVRARVGVRFIVRLWLLLVF